jgi:hypothetical protein
MTKQPQSVLAICPFCQDSEEHPIVNGELVCKYCGKPFPMPDESVATATSVGRVIVPTLTAPKAPRISSQQTKPTASKKGKSETVIQKQAPVHKQSTKNSMSFLEQHRLLLSNLHFTFYMVSFAMIILYAIIGIIIVGYFTVHPKDLIDVTSFPVWVRLLATPALFALVYLMACYVHGAIQFIRE